MESFEAEVVKRRKDTYEYLMSTEYQKRLTTRHMQEAFYSYIHRGGKSLRSVMLLFCCGAVGGEERTALPAAGAIEVYHTMTLVHDDIIDKDEMRRGGPTVHIEFRDRAVREFRFPKEEARHYGVSIALLVGDLQHSLAISLMCELYTKMGLDPKLVLSLINDLTLGVGPTLVEGETLDLQFSRFDVGSLGDEAIVDMLRRKTGALFEFAGATGAMIGLNQYDRQLPLVKALSNYALNCGIAFQLQDDILGILGDEQTLGKPIGSDVREGKRTAIVDFALKHASPRERETLLSILGNRHASREQTQEVIHLLHALGGIDHARDLAAKHVKEALSQLETVPESKYRNFLTSMAQYVVERDI